MRAYAHAGAAWLLFVVGRAIYLLGWAMHLLTSGVLRVLNAVEAAQAYHTHRARELEGDLDDDGEEDCA